MSLFGIDWSKFVQPSRAAQQLEERSRATTAQNAEIEARLRAGTPAPINPAVPANAFADRELIRQQQTAEGIRALTERGIGTRNKLVDSKNRQDNLSADTQLRYGKGQSEIYRENLGFGMDKQQSQRMQLIDAFKQLGTDQVDQVLGGANLKDFMNQENAFLNKRLDGALALANKPATFMEQLGQGVGAIAPIALLLATLTGKG